MLVLLILLVSILIFRGLGFAGVSAFASWPAALRDGLAVMLPFTASAHFTPMKEDLIRMTPQWVPKPRAMVFFTGLCEIAGAIGLVIPTTRRAAGIALILFFIAVLPANIHDYQSSASLHGDPSRRTKLPLPRIRCPSSEPTTKTLRARDCWSPRTVRSCMWKSLVRPLSLLAMAEQSGLKPGRTGRSFFQDKINVLGFL